MSNLNCNTTPDAFFCPSKWDLWRQILRLRRPGRANQMHEAPVYATDENGDPEVESLTVQDQYWAAVAEAFEYVHQRACALLDEMFCETKNETDVRWAHEFGFPDDCEPYENVCEKMRDLGGQSCAFFIDLAARRGWSLTCYDCSKLPVSASADCAVADCAVDCECEPNTLIFRIDLNNSLAYLQPKFVEAIADKAVSDCNSPCPPDVSQLQCLIERYKPAHVRAFYEVT